MPNISQNLTLLLVEDEPSLREVLAFEFERLGIRVVAAGDGLEAVTLLRHLYSQGDSVNVVVSDIRMPGMNGIDLLSEIQKQFSQLPVILMSGFTDLSAAKLAKLGAHALISKPFDMDELLAAVFDCCSGFRRRQT